MESKASGFSCLSEAGQMTEKGSNYHCLSKYILMLCLTKHKTNPVREHFYKTVTKLFLNQNKVRYNYAIFNKQHSYY